MFPTFTTFTAKLVPRVEIDLGEYKNPGAPRSGRTLAPHGVRGGCRGLQRPCAMPGAERTGAVWLLILPAGRLRCSGRWRWRPRRDGDCE